MPAKTPTLDITPDMREEAKQEAPQIPDYIRSLPSVVICSIWPEALESEPRPREGAGRKVYRIEAGSLEKPAYLRVYTTWDLVKSSIGDPGKPPEMGQGFISASLEAENLIKYWCLDHIGNVVGRKGVGIIAGDKATPVELKELNRVQTAFLHYLVEYADRCWRSNRPNDHDKIQHEHRHALELLHLDTKLHPWYTNVVKTYNLCPYCQESTDNFAIVCPRDHKIAEYFLERDIVPDATQWPKVSEEYNRLKAKAAKAN